MEDSFSWGLISSIYNPLPFKVVVTDVDKLVERMGQCFLSVVEEYTDKEWADNVSVLMKISSVTSQELLTFSRSMVYN